MGVKEDKIADLTKEIRELDKQIGPAEERRATLDQLLGANKAQASELRIEIAKVKKSEGRLTKLAEEVSALTGEDAALLVRLEEWQASKRVAEVQIKALKEMN